MGVITAATLKLFARPKSVGHSALCQVPDPKAALAAIGAWRAIIVGEAVSAFRTVACAEGMRFVAQTLPDVRLPFADATWSGAVLIEAGHWRQRCCKRLCWNSLFEAALEAEIVERRVDRSEPSASETSLLELCVNTYRLPTKPLVGSVASHDISLPLGGGARFYCPCKRRYQMSRVLARSGSIVLAILEMAICTTICSRPKVAIAVIMTPSVP